MNWLLLLLLLATPAPSTTTTAVTETPAGQAFRLGSGEYRWVPFTVNLTPADVEIQYEVLQGDPTVHAELLAMNDFRQFNRGRPHGSLGVTADSRVAGFRKAIVVRGQYAVVISNAKGAVPATVSLVVKVDTDPKDGSARELPPGKRLLVILCSFLFFLITVGWSGNRLIRAIRRS